jgi:hypothetical protein
MGASTTKTVISWTDHAGSDPHGRLIMRARGYDVIGCEVCGFHHIVPLPDRAKLHRLHDQTSR